MGQDQQAQPPMHQPQQYQQQPQQYQQQPQQYQQQPQQYQQQPQQYQQQPQQYQQPYSGYSQEPVKLVQGVPAQGVPHYQQPGAVYRVQQRDWKYDCCDCFSDVGLCCEVYWCYPCHEARLHDAITLKKNDSLNPAVCAGLCLGYLLLGGLACCLHTWYLRDNYRREYAIAGDPCADCCMACCCLPCALCQMHRESKHHGVDPGTTCCESITPLEAPPVVQPAVQPGHVIAGHKVAM